MRRPTDKSAKARSERVTQLDSHKPRRLNLHGQAQIERGSGDFVFLKLIAAVGHVEDVQGGIERPDRKPESPLDAEIGIAPVSLVERLPCQKEIGWEGKKPTSLA
jgi:hypothetical protein